MLLLVMIVALCGSVAFFQPLEYSFKFVSTLSSSVELPLGARTYDKYTGELYVGSLYGTGMHYSFLPGVEGSVTKYFFLDSLPEDPTLLNWQYDALFLNSVLTSHNLMFEDYILLRTFNGSGDVLFEGVALNPVRFDVSVDNCLMETVDLNAVTQARSRSWN